MTSQDKIQRTVLPIPDQPHVGLTTYDAKDPDTKYPPIRELRPPQGAPPAPLAVHATHRLITPEERFRVAMARQ